MGIAYKRGIADVFILPIVDSPASALVWAAMPAAETELLGLTTRRFPVNLLGASQFRWHVDRGVAGDTGAVLRAKFSVNAGAAWTALEDTTSLADVSLFGTGLVSSAWGPVVAAAQAGSGDALWIAPFGQGGNAVLSPAILRAYLEFR